MKKNGFTLIELIGSVVILALIALVALPSIINLLKTGQRKLDSSVKQIVEQAAIDYVNNNLDDYPKNNVDKSIDPLECKGDPSKCICGNDISYKTLEDQGYIDKSVRDKNSKAITTESYIKIYCNSERYKAKFFGGSKVDKEVTIKFKKGNNVSNIGMTSKTCIIASGDESCNILTPSITPNKGYSSAGWSKTKGDTTGINAGKSISISSNGTYYANAIDDNCPSCSLKLKSATSTSATIEADCYDPSGINYEYSFDGGSFEKGGSTKKYNSFRLSKIKLRSSDNKGNTCIKGFSKGNIEVAYETITDVLEKKYDELNSKEDAFSQNQILNKMYPVGSIYISQSSANPSSTLGGSWERYGNGRTLVGAGNGYNAGSTGGSSTVTLNASNLPSHNHGYTPSGSVSSWFSGNGFSVNAGDHSHYIGYNKTGNTGEAWGASLIDSSHAGGFENRVLIEGGQRWTNWTGGHTLSYTASGSVSSWFSGYYGTTSNAGGSQAFSIMNPYITVYMWRRTA